MSTLVFFSANSNLRRFLPSASKDITLSKSSLLHSSIRSSYLYSKSSPFVHRYLPSSSFSSLSHICQISAAPSDVSVKDYDLEYNSGTDDLTLKEIKSTDSDSSAKEHRLGAVPTKKPHFTPEIDNEIIRLRELNHSWSTIGSMVGIPYRSCNRRYNALLDPSLNEVWSSEKIQQLDELVAEGKPWIEISQILGMSVSSCQVKWRWIVKPEGQFRNRMFDVVQSKVILSIVKEHGEGDWKFNLREFMKRLGGRDMATITATQLRHQYYNLQRRSQHIWSLDEETLLIQHVLKHGMGNWEPISEILKSHTPEQCKEKWLELDMKTKEPRSRAWYKTERGSFWRLYKIYGNNWTEIASQLKKRTPENCRQLFENETAGFSKEDPEEFEKRVQELADECSSYVTRIWKKHESEKLWELVERHIKENKIKRANWNIIAEQMDMGLTPNQYKHHHYYLRLIKKNGGLSGAWTKEEEQVLERAVRELGRDWKAVSKKYLPHRNTKSLCHKFNSIKHKGAYITPQEYEILLSAVERQEEEHFHKNLGDVDKSALGNFTPNWKIIAKSMPGGTWTAEQCMDAYKSSFKSHLRNSTWTKEQDQQLLDMVKELGRKNWIGIALRIQGKDTWECRLRWAELQDPAQLKIGSRTSIIPLE